MDQIELLEQIVRNTGPKMSFHILISGKSTRIRTKFNPLIQLDEMKKYEMALVNLKTYYSIPNIDRTNNNFRYSPDNSTTWFNIVIPEGCYEITDNNVYVRRSMRNNVHYDSARDKHYISIEPNNTLKSVLENGANYKVDFTTANSIRTVLGFNSHIYSEGYNESENIVNILSISSLRVTSDVIGSSYTNEGPKILYTRFFKT